MFRSEGATTWCFEPRLDMLGSSSPQPPQSSMALFEGMVKTQRVIKMSKLKLQHGLRALGTTKYPNR